jgi:hypothetical protein
MLENSFSYFNWTIVNSLNKTIKKLFWGDFWIFTIIENYWKLSKIIKNYQKLRQKLSLSIKKIVIELSLLVVPSWWQVLVPMLESGVLDAFPQIRVNQLTFWNQGLLMLVHQHSWDLVQDLVWQLEWVGLNWHDSWSWTFWGPLIGLLYCWSFESSFPHL